MVQFMFLIISLKYSCPRYIAHSQVYPLGGCICLGVHHCCWTVLDCVALQYPSELLLNEFVSIAINYLLETGYQHSQFMPKATADHFER